MRLLFCGCGQPLWAPECAERGFCEYCRMHHCTHWPAFGYHPRGLPYFFPQRHENPYRKADAEPVVGFNLMRTDDGVLLHRHTCSLLDEKAIPWLWANSAELGEILYAAAYFGYSTCVECHPLARYDAGVVLHV